MEEVPFEVHPLNVYDLLSRNASHDSQHDREFDLQEFSSLLKRKRTLSTREHWKLAVDKALHLSDPWECFHLETLESQVSKRYRYNALKKSWVTDQVTIKMPKESFSRGAMRECFRMKKLSNFTHNPDWKAASNYVGKRYMNQVSRTVYMEDVKLQMEAKLWSEEYNRCHPPKKIDIMQVSLLELPNGELYHLEHFMEGDYVKYNSNSGFISSENLRLTPQAFSHFTFERSGHDLIVVDIQGVGDLYTDPQIHTGNGEGYGEGNLGPRGMALFFKSHVCNHICSALQLSPFDLSHNEGQLNHNQAIKLDHCETQVRVLRSESSIESTSSLDDFPSPGFLSEDSGVGLNYHPPFKDPVFRRLRSRYESESSFENTDEDRMAYQELLGQRARPSCIQPEKVKDEKRTLGQVHLEFVCYYQQGRFNGDANVDGSFDMISAMFHLEKSAECGCLPAILSLANLLLGREPQHLQQIKFKVDVDTGLEYLIQAGLMGDRESAIELGRRFQSGDGLGTKRSMSWQEAVDWFDRALEWESGNKCLEDSLDENPNYSILGRMAEMVSQGGHGLDKDANEAYDLYTRAGDAAQEAGKGRLATKYYMLAEEQCAD